MNNIFLQLSDILIYVTMLGLPTVISIITDDMLLLATITGSYPGKSGNNPENRTHVIYMLAPA